MRNWFEYELINSYTDLFSAKEKGRLSKDLHPRVHISTHIHGSVLQGIMSEAANEFEVHLKKNFRIQKFVG